MRVRWTCLAMLALAPTTAVAAAAPTPQAEVRAIVRAAHVPGGVLLIRSHGHTHLVAAGYANLATHARMRVDDRFRIASVTKPFVATLVLQLVAEGRLSLDDTVEQLLPGLLPNGAQVHVSELLNHTAGLPEYSDLPSVWARYRNDPAYVISEREIVRLAYATPVATDAPGDVFAYSNTNYVVAGMIVEAATGQTLAADLADRIATPLGLRHTFIPPDARIPPPLAHGYTTRDGDYFADAHGHELDTTTLDPSLMAGAGAVVSNARDLERFIDSLLGGNLLPPAERLAMITPIHAARDAQDHALGYGFGMGIARVPCGILLGHTGVLPGYRSWMFRSSDGSRTGVLLLNGTPRTDEDYSRADAVFVKALCR